MRKPLLHHLRVQGLVATRTKHGREIGRLQFTQLQIRIRDRQGPATPVASWPRVCTRALRPHPKTRAIKLQK